MVRQGAIATFILCALTAFSQAPERCSLEIAWDPYEPYSYVGESGVVTGFDIDVVNRVADHLGCTINFSQKPWADVLSAIEAGAVDIAVGTNYHPARVDWSWYSEPYRDEVIGLMVRRGEADRFHGDSLADVLKEGLRFGMTLDDSYSGDIAVALQAYSEQVAPRVGERANIDQLIRGEIDGFLIERRVGAAHLRHMGLTKQVDFHALSFPAGRYRFQFSKASIEAAFLARFNAALQHLKDSGAIAEIAARYELAPPTQ